MQLALEQAEKAAKEQEVPIGAVLVSGQNLLLACAYNQPIKLSDPTAHAEILCLRQAAEQQKNYRLPGSTLYVTLEPCTMCAGALVHARIRRLVFAASEPRTGSIHSIMNVLDNPSLNHRIMVDHGLCDEQAAQLMKQFFKQRRKSQSGKQDAI